MKGEGDGEAMSFCLPCNDRHSNYKFSLRSGLTHLFALKQKTSEKLKEAFETFFVARLRLDRRLSAAESGAATFDRRVGASQNTLPT